MSERLTATPETCASGGISTATSPAVLEVDPGTEIVIEAVTHHAGDAPDLLMDAGVTAIWNGIAEADRAPGVHIMTGPIHVRGAEPGDTLRVELLDMRPRVPYGSNCAANWGLFHERFGKERITIYELVDPPTTGEFTSTARPMFGFDFTALELYDIPGCDLPNRIRRGASRSASRRGAGAPAPRRDGRRARFGRATQQHPAGRVRRQRRQLAVRPRGHRALPGVHPWRRLLRRRSALRAG